MDDFFQLHHVERNGEKGLKRSIFFAILVSLIIFCVEFFGGIQSGSVALLADAGHIVTDSIALFLSLTAVILASKKPNHRFSFGYFRIEILTALLNSVLIFGISFFILFEAIERLQNQKEILSFQMFLYSSAGIILNLLSAWVLFRFSDENINVKSAYIHVLSDLLATVGVLLGSLLIHFTGWTWVDAAISVLISLLILRSAWGIFRESLFVLLESAPASLDIPHVLEHIRKVNGIETVLDYHFWAVTRGVNACTLRVGIAPSEKQNSIIFQCTEILKSSFGIDFVTIQCEDSGLTERLKRLVVNDAHGSENRHRNHGHHHH
ncbi:cation diffusion facilitator family transporter [Leptospira ellisii]|uniref:Cation diffusion facilitator family transporter n=1 Tax=Leptospira ellisii TaxID=2023197 RepID=A0A2N0BK59_9LEPT|nr:cation diffusion facilitator family transporter [Leptospira ellisii]MDV6235078.1 cation diffusion facilitator family transporter [Leptospira ellisii]PJZ93258.1 cation transporter [Leptospira ellisii]PKA04376.1 cation transporter [Leptospira ellisii]